MVTYLIFLNLSLSELHTLPTTTPPPHYNALFQSNEVNQFAEGQCQLLRQPSTKSQTLIILYTHIEPLKPIPLHHFSSDKSDNRFDLTHPPPPHSNLIFSDMSRKEEMLRTKSDSVSIQRTQNQHAWGYVEMIKHPHIRPPPFTPIFDNPATVLHTL